MKLPASSTVRMPPLPEGWSVIGFAVLANGGLAIIGDDQAVVANSRSVSGAGFDPEAYQHRVEVARARLWTFDGLTLSEQFEFSLESPFPALDQLPDGRWLIVCRRTLGEANARLFDSDGRLLSRLMLGDGVQAVQCDAEGRVWVGWFDEGVFGNEGWRMPGREWPPSSSVVAAFDTHGEVAWEPRYQPEHMPADCYALNVSDGVVWAWMYGAAQVQRLTIGDDPQTWIADAAGATAIAVQDDYLLVAGGYGPAFETIRLLKLAADGVAATVATWNADLPARNSGLLCEIAGRGDRIHVITALEWRQWRVVDAVGSA